jgi:hypothetical protein
MYAQLRFTKLSGPTGTTCVGVTRGPRGGHEGASRRLSPKVSVTLLGLSSKRVFNFPYFLLFSFGDSRCSFRRSPRSSFQLLLFPALWR